jgi:hypothetical protein
VVAVGATKAVTTDKMAVLEEEVLVRLVAILLALELLGKETMAVLVQVQVQIILLVAVVGAHLLLAAELAQELLVTAEQEQPQVLLALA